MSNNINKAIALDVLSLRPMDERLHKDNSGSINLDAVSVGRVYDTFLPVWAVGVRAAADLDRLGAEARELVRAEGQLTLGEIATLTGSEKGKRRGPKRQIIPEVEDRAGAFEAPVFDDALSYDAWLRAGGRVHLSEDERLNVALDDGQAVIALCYGRDYLRTGVVLFNGSGMAARAARFIYGKRGVAANGASLADAAASAAAAVWAAWQGYTLALTSDGETGELQQARDGADLSLACMDGASIWGLAAVAWRAAFKSLTDDGRAGRTGRQAAQCTFTLPLESSRTVLDKGEAKSVSLVDLESLRAWAIGGGNALLPSAADTSKGWQARTISTEHSHKRRAVEWLRVTLGATRIRRTAGGAKTTASKVWRQWVYLSWLLLGASPMRAAKAACFCDQWSAYESMRADKVWDKLREAAVGLPSALEVERRQALREAGACARAAWAKLSSMAGVLPYVGPSAVVRPDRSRAAYAVARRGGRVNARIAWAMAAQWPVKGRKYRQALCLSASTLGAIGQARKVAVFQFELACNRVSVARNLLAQAREARLGHWRKAANGLRSGERKQRRADKAKAKA